MKTKDEKEEEELRKLDKAFKEAKARETKKVKTSINLLEELKGREDLSDVDIAAIKHTIELISGSNTHSSGEVGYITY